MGMWEKMESEIRGTWSLLHGVANGELRIEEK